MRPSPCHRTAAAPGGRCRDVFEFPSVQRDDGASLFSPIPVRKRRALGSERQAGALGIDKVAADHGDASRHHGPVLFRGAIRPVASRKSRQASADYCQHEAAIGAQH